MDKKVIGYLIAIIGILILGFGVSLFQTLILSIIGMICVGAGVVIIIMFSEKSSSRDSGKKAGKGKIKDLPVYEGDNIVAYRRN